LLWLVQIEASDAILHPALSESHLPSMPALCYASRQAQLSEMQCTMVLVANVDHETATVLGVFVVHFFVIVELG